MEAKTLKFMQGLNQKPDAEISDGLIEAQDVLYERIGSIRAAQANSTGISYGSQVHSLGLEGQGLDEILLAGTGTNLYYAENLLKSNFSGLNLSFASALSRIYMTNLTDGLWMYGGTTPLYRAGSPVPTALAAAGSGAGSFTGTYNVKVTFVNANGFEGNPSDADSTGALANNLVDLTSIPVNTDTDYNISKRRIWISGGTTPLYVDYVLLTTINDNSTTAVAGINTSSVTSTVLATNNNLPPKMKFVFNHYDTLFGGPLDTDTQSIQFSKAAGPEQWPVAQTFRISRTGDPVQWGVTWAASAWIVTRKKVYQIIGSPGSGALQYNFFPKESQSQYGTIAPRSVVATPYGIVFQGEDGIRIFDGSSSKVFSNEIETTMNARGVGDAQEALSVGAFGGDKYLLSFCSASAATPDTTVIYDWKTEKWSTHGNGYFAYAADRRNNQIFCGTSTGIDTFRGAGTYAAWRARTMDLTAQVGSYGSFAKFQVDMEGSCDAQVYLDDVLSGSYGLTAATRAFVTRRFPLGLSQRAAITLIGSAKATQDKIYSIVYSTENQKGMP